MNRRDRSPCGVVMAVACLFVGAFTDNAIEAGSPQRPNIVLIVADDLGYGSLGCYGSTEIATPHIDRLAVRGVRMTDFHANGPMCAPTRAALLTGRYQQRCAWVDDVELAPPFREQRRANPKQRWAWGISAAEVTLAEVLRDAGYATGLCGKWHLGYDRAFHPLHHGFDEFRGYVGGAVDYHTHVATHGLRELDWWNGSAIAHEEGYSTDLLTRYATDFIERHRDDPFFLELAHGAPHTPLQGRDPMATKPPLATYREMIGALDDSVGAVVATLEACGLTERTIVVFCSDNGAQPPKGIAANGRLRGRKGDLFEGGHRVPCIVTCPGRIPAGCVMEATGMTMDFLPTFVGLAEATIPAGHEIDGIDLVPLLSGATPSGHRELHWLFDGAWAVREGPWKLIGRDETPEMLVNLADDLAEETNRMAMEPERTEKLLMLHQRWAAAVGTR